MRQYQGKAVFSGVASGKVLFYGKKQDIIRREHVSDIESEIARFEEAIRVSIGQLGKLYEKALLEVGEKDAAIFEVHQMLLEDEDFSGAVKEMIHSQMVCAEYAVATTGDNFARMFESMDDEYMRARSEDIKDIAERVIHVLNGKKMDETQRFSSSEPVIIVAEDLSPSETIQMDKSKILAFVTRRGSANSHTAILAKSMNIPALVGVDIDPSWNGLFAVVDGMEGYIYIEPEQSFLQKMEERKQREEQKKKMLLTLKGKPTQTKDGVSIRLYANIGNIGDAWAAMHNDAAGIGLFRSEFLYLEKHHYPTEDEQFLAYKSVAEIMAGKKVIIRTLDIGADKKLDYFPMEKEENPALGYRAIRICLDHPELFKTQLRAILRASAFGNVAIMYPMIISVEEVRKIKKIMEEVKAELREVGILFNENMEQGIMIETPAAVMISDLLAKEVDFFSIGTNDLTQYTLAIDRQNAKLDAIYNPHHEAVLRMIKLVCDNGHREGCWVGICGELGADTSLTEQFLRMGIDELSVSPSFILKVRQAVRNITIHS
ncbi:MAG: phosphoenolpyruvate--protein phosphotransferase [Lachnospiraceae bacterium]